MRDAARWQTIIDLLDQILHDRVPADLALRRWSRSSRFAGSKDRRFIGDQLFGISRRLGVLQWLLEAPESTVLTGRGVVLAEFASQPEPDLAAIEGLFDGSQHAPAALDDDERTRFHAMAARTANGEMPPALALGIPVWAETGFKRSFPETWRAEAMALLEPASVDLRLRDPGLDRASILGVLAGRGIEAQPTPYSPLGIRLEARFGGGELPEVSDGILEVQDEASTLAALLLGAQPGERVLDLCAGAGGKTLVLAASMKGRGELMATDRDPHRLAEAEKRLQRAGHERIACKALDVLSPAGSKALGGNWDRVLLDAPCSGVGTWRRAPDARWRMRAEDLAALLPVQDSLLDRAAALTAESGRLLYVTCSLLAEENSDRVAAFLARHPDFREIPAAEAWDQAIPSLSPPELCAQPHGGLMTPARHGTDGFYMAVLQRN